MNVEKETLWYLGKLFLKILHYDDEHDFLTVYEHNQLVCLCDITAEYFERL